jgi:hypothetical protein
VSFFQEVSGMTQTVLNFTVESTQEKLTPELEKLFAEFLKAIQVDCRRHPYVDTTPELMWIVRRDACGHRVGVHVDTSML